MASANLSTTSFLNAILDEVTTEQAAMEIEDPGSLMHFLEPSSEETSQDSLCNANASMDFNPSSLSMDEGPLTTAEALLDNLIHDVCNMDCDSSQLKDSKDYDIDKKSDTKETVASGVKTQVPKHPFQLSDNMKKGLSMLAFPAKMGHSRKKGLKSSRTTSNYRITIGEALEKAQDARKNMISILKGTGEEETAEGSIASDTKASGSSSLMRTKQTGKTKVDTVEKGLSGKSDVDKDTVGEKENWRNTTTVPAQSVTTSQSSNNQHIKGDTTSKEDKRVPLAGKSKSSTFRVKLSPRMWELLRFTFRHEHFPTSVHMARLAKMMGIQWSQIRNWFTDRRLENKRAGIFPRDKSLDHCIFCDVLLKTEAEQKSHLFSANHVKNILGQEYVGANSSEPIKWRKIPKNLNAFNKVSGARVLAVGFPNAIQYEAPTVPEDSPTPPPPRLNEELNKKTKIKLRKIQKRWEESMQVQNEKGQCSTSVVTQENKRLKQPVKNDKLRNKSEGAPFRKLEDGGDRIKGNDHDQANENLIENEKVKHNNKVNHIPSSTDKSKSVASHSHSDSSNSEYLEELSEVSSMSKERNKQDSAKVPTKNLSQEEKRIALELKYANIDDKLARILDFTGPPMHEPKFESIFECEDDKIDQSSQTTCKKKTIEEHVKKLETSDMQRTEEPLTSISESSQGSSSPTTHPHSSKPRTRACEGSSSSAGTAQASPKRTAHLRTPRTGPVRFKSPKNTRNALDEAVIGYRCPTCTKIFLTEWLMIKHSITHLMYQCDICEQVYPSETLLKHHILDHLTGAYEDEKYYYQLSCKVCHSLKCECYEASFCKAKEIPKAYNRPQRARRTKKTFISKPNSSPNDHLLVTLADCKRLFQVSVGLGNVRSGKPGVNTSKKSENTSGNSNCSTPQKLQTQESEHEADAKHVKQEESTELESQDCLDKTKQTVSPGNSKDTSGLILQNNLMDIKIESVTSPSSDIFTEEESMGADRGKRPCTRRRANKLSNNFVYKDTDFYYMCEMCDASFLSKAELGEHKFFHRLKSRSRRGEKRGPPDTVGEVLKRLKVEEVQSDEVETIDVGGFKRFKCPLCKGHFASVTDLNRHRTQAHKGCDTDISLDLMPVQCTEVFQCTYCEKYYRRERELRRHLKHDCVSAPKYLKEKLSMGVTLTYLQNLGDGPHYRMVKRNQEESSLQDQSSSKPVSRGPIACKYCSMVTRREAEMKRHIWKYCPKVPKDVVKRFKEGTTLEELGFSYTIAKTEHTDISDTVAIPKAEENESKPTKEPVPEIPKSESPISQDDIPPTSPVLPYPAPLPIVSSKSKEPLVCSYCGIWYFREMAILKHMRERCIKLPAREKELLNNGARICNLPQKTDESSSSSKFRRAIYKMVQAPEHSAGSVQLPTQMPEETLIKEEPIEPSKEISDEGMKGETHAVVDKVQGLVIDKKPVGKRGYKKGTRCRRCHDTFKSVEAVLAHSSVHHGPKKGMYKCKLCQLKLQKYKHLREHVWEHTEETPYRCHICEERFRASEVLIEHLHAHHNFDAINERNLYKWLPGRNGKYRDIKSSVQDSCEESLEDLDATLDNLAEVMVITDHDIWTGRSEANISEGKEDLGVGKVTDVTHQETTGSSQSLKLENTNLQTQDLSSTNPQSVNLSPENKTSRDEILECKKSSSDEYRNGEARERVHSAQNKGCGKKREKHNSTSGTDSLKVEEKTVHTETKTLTVDDNEKLEEKASKMGKGTGQLESSIGKAEKEAFICSLPSIKTEKEDLLDLVEENETIERSNIKREVEEVRESLGTRQEDPNNKENNVKGNDEREVTTMDENRGEGTKKEDNKEKDAAKADEEKEVTAKEDNQEEITGKRDNDGKVTEDEDHQGNVHEEWAVEGKVIAKEGLLTTEREATDIPEELGRLKSIVIDDSLDDNYAENGEGLLSTLDNLESVIETIQLTDKHFS